MGTGESFGIKNFLVLLKFAEPREGYALGRLKQENIITVLMENMEVYGDA